MSPMPQTPPPDDDFPQKPLERPLFYVSTSRSRRAPLHLVEGPLPKFGWPDIRPLCGLDAPRWRYLSRASHLAAPIPNEAICPRCLAARGRQPETTKPLCPHDGAICHHECDIQCWRAARGMALSEGQPPPLHEVAS